MGQSSSAGRRRNDYYQQSPSFSFPAPPPPPNQPPPTPSVSSHPPPPPPSQPPPPLPSSYYNVPSTVPNPSASYYHQSSPWAPRPTYPQYYGPSRSGGWWMPPPPRPPYSQSSAIASHPAAPAPPYVEQAKKVKNDVNVHKESIRLVPDERNPDCHLVSFTFDAMVDGSVTIYYFAKEGANCKFLPLYADMYTPKQIPFLKGPGQKFIQPSGNGIDLGFFDLDELSHPLQGDTFPLVIYAEYCRTSPSEDQNIRPSNTACGQITQAVIEKNNDGNFEVKAVKQILWVDGERYELQEIYGLASIEEPEATGEEDADVGKDCVICLSEPRDTAVLPCRHMCMCHECAKALRLQSNKCPICRQPVEKLMEIKVNNAEP